MNEKTHTPKPLAFDFMVALGIAERVFEKYKADQPRWWKRMDGTPILSDVSVRMAEAFRDEFKKAIEAHAQHIKSFLEELAPYLGVDGEGEFKPRDLIDAANKIRESLNSHAALTEQNAKLANRVAELEALTDWKHTDDVAVNRFCVAMIEKLAKKRDEGRGGWDDPQECTIDMLAKMLVAHVAKGDPVDIANFCMMVWTRGETDEDHAPAVQAIRDAALASASKTTQKKESGE